MDVGGHHVAERVENHPVTLETACAGERGRDYPDGEMAAAVTCPRMPDMTMAVVVDLQQLRREGLLKQFTHSLDADLVHGATCTNGLI